MRPVRLADQPKAEEPHVFIDFYVDKGNAIALPAPLSGVAVQDSHDVLSAHEGAPAGFGRQGSLAIRLLDKMASTH